jgi:DNA-binding PadR family transcriptional regulator
MTTDLALLQGTLDTLVLKTLSWGPRHGYAVARWIKAGGAGMGGVAVGSFGKQ